MRPIVASVVARKSDAMLTAWTTEVVLLCSGATSQSGSVPRVEHPVRALPRQPQAAERADLGNTGCSAPEAEPAAHECALDGVSASGQVAWLGLMSPAPRSVLRQAQRRWPRHRVAGDTPVGSWRDDAGPPAFADSQRARGVGEGRGPLPHTEENSTGACPPHGTTRSSRVPLRLAPDCPIVITRLGLTRPVYGPAPQKWLQRSCRLGTQLPPGRLHSERQARDHGSSTSAQNAGSPSVQARHPLAHPGDVSHCSSATTRVWNPSQLLPGLKLATAALKQDQNAVHGSGSQT